MAPVRGNPHPAAICLDGRNLALRDGTGVATYAGTLARGLRQTGRVPEVLLDAAENTVSRTGRPARWLRAAWFGPRHAREQATPPEGFTRSLLAPDAFRLAQVHFDIHGKLLAIASRRPPPLMHWTYPLPLVFHGVPNVYTIHDLIPLRRPDLTNIDAGRFARIVRHVARRAAHIVTVSEASRRDIVTLLGVAEDRVTNTYEPVDWCGGTQNAPEDARRDADGDASGDASGRASGDASGGVPGHIPGHIPGHTPPRQGYFLFCGSIEPRKNVARLIEAYQASGVVAPLILAGPDGWRAAEALAGAEIRPLAAQTGAGPGSGGIWRVPWLPRPLLIDLLRGARALLFPSLAEGFGLPIAEAMAMGVPVLTSAGGATGEIAGDAALLIDPLDVRAMAEAIAVLDRDASLCARLAAAGTARSSLFSPGACFNRLAAVYDSLGVARA